MRTSRLIRNERWEFIVLTRAAYEKQEGVGKSEGVTYPNNKVYFLLPKFTEDIVAHELFHVYAFTRAVCPSERADDREEGLAIIMERHRKNYMKQIDEITAELLKQIEKKYP